ncbi:hypothetical protein M670_03264 [Schinkia azotoformans MEV2011]|uniref:Uncharacterized protein n=1 Tax=Schinkia azotoformans MEV2011 TaxID=1348973 RepID=A0A072NJK1_SCHAZ|nr:hypothetical protein [Schinkia azotoformans]KEF37457.1 hypothetical protein M670_03264 [Schinkia azotoformans MEV2011]MEC1697729.1 hypothetical protein [Schinkia azotoformans]MEC1715917.1 hypothetical protein [Schinkia azotoformans]MEC1726196.1 hypothetical protein [Schinkia azotoformans]MEC1741556.1 hypothetical protein [Schinkia azotoformans]
MKKNDELYKDQQRISTIQRGITIITAVLLLTGQRVVQFVEIRKSLYL